MPSSGSAYTNEVLDLGIGGSEARVTSTAVSSRGSPSLRPGILLAFPAVCISSGYISFPSFQSFDYSIGR